MGCDFDCVDHSILGQERLTFVRVFNDLMEAKHLGSRAVASTVLGAAPAAAGQCCAAHWASNNMADRRWWCGANARSSRAKFKAEDRVE